MIKTIHESASIAPTAQLGQNVSIGPFAVIEDGVSIGDNSTIGAHAIIRSHSRIGHNTSIDSFSVIGGLPQDLKVTPTDPFGPVIIGNHVTIRESVTINKATNPEGTTSVGDHTLMMACAHAGHDVQIANNAIIANAVLLGGFVRVDAYAYLAGNAVFHPEVRIGESVIAAGCSTINLDIPPFLMVSQHNRVHGLNLIGVKRRGFSHEQIDGLKTAFNRVLNQAGNPYKLAAELVKEDTPDSPIAKTFLDFFEARGKKGSVSHRHLMLNR